MYADLHVHSRYSDGTQLPRQLVEAAKKAGVTLLSITDHNEIGSWPEAREAAARLGISLIDGAEIDAIYEGEDLHILAYGASERDDQFVKTVKYARARLDEMSDELIRRVAKAGGAANPEEYAAYERDPGLGGWKALYYLAACGECESPKAALALYERYGVTYENAGFSPAEDVIRAIHGAGGFAILAHPGEMAGKDGRLSLEAKLSRIASLFDMGLDGVECLYPKHDPKATRSFLSLCHKEGKLVTSGSDCHGAFSGKPVGFLRARLDELRLGALNGSIIPPRVSPEAPL